MLGSMRGWVYLAMVLLIIACALLGVVMSWSGAWGWSLIAYTAVALCCLMWRILDSHSRFWEPLEIEDDILRKHGYEKHIIKKDPKTGRLKVTPKEDSKQD